MTGPPASGFGEGDPEQNLDKEYPEKARPAVVSHPVTGRPILFVNPLHTHGFQGMAKDEAWQLIEELAAHSTQNRFVYYHSWQVGDLPMWDERATMHRGAGDYRPDERRIRRCARSSTRTRRNRLNLSALLPLPGESRDPRVVCSIA